MSLSGVAGARGRLLLHRRTAHCAFLSVPRGLQQRFGGRVGLTADGARKGVLGLF